jgi:hypothetical protein
MLGPLVALRSRFLELLIVVEAWSFITLRLLDAIQRVIYALGLSIGNCHAGGAEQARVDLAC